MTAITKLVDCKTGTLPVQKDPLQISTSQAIIAAIGTAGILGNYLSDSFPQSSAIFNGSLLLLNVFAEIGLNYQAYKEMNPQTGWEKGIFVATSLAALPTHYIIKTVPAIKRIYDLVRLSSVAKGSIGAITNAYCHYSKDKWKALKHFTVHSLSLANAIYQTRDTLTWVGKKMDSVFSSFLNFPQAEAASPFSENQYSFAKCESSEVRQERLLKEVEEALKNGGKLELIPSNSGVYKVIDQEGQAIAVFKPSDERMWGPLNRNPEFRREEPNIMKIMVYQMSSFEQGSTAERQHLAQQFDYNCFANMPAGVMTELTSDLFIDPECSDTLKCPPRTITKKGFLQEFISSKPRVLDFESEAVEMETRGEKIPYEIAYSFQTSDILNKVPKEEFQKIGILDILLFNEDRNKKNILVDYDGKTHHLIPIDHDSILPFQFKRIRSIFEHPRATEPFCQSSLDFINSLDPSIVAQKVRDSGIGEQAASNAAVLAMVLQKFATAGKTLRDLYQFVSLENAPYEDPDKTSILWQLMEQSRNIATKKLPTEDQAMFRHYEHLKWLTVHQKSLPIETGESWMRDYERHHHARIGWAISDSFWEELVKRVSQYLS